MKRREFIALLGGAAAAWPVPVSGQVSNKRPLVGFLSTVVRERNVRMSDAFFGGLRQLGYIEGRDFDLAFRSVDGHFEKIPAAAAEMLQLKPDVILATVTPTVIALRELSQTVPIVCPLIAYPARFRLMASEARPGGNVTGVLFRVEGLAGKQLEVGLQLVPGAKTVGMLFNAAGDAGGVVIDRQEAESAAADLGVTLIAVGVRGPEDIGPAFRTLVETRVQAVLVLTDGLFFNERQRLAILAAEARLPAFYAFRDHVDAGGLISYGVDLADCFRRAASYVAKILKGEKPGDLPAEFPTKLELLINLRAAKALDLEVPTALILRADELVE